MLAYYLEWHLRGVERVAVRRPPTRGRGSDTRFGRRQSTSFGGGTAERPNAPDDRRPAGAELSFQCLLRNLATLCKNRVCWSSHPDAEFDRLTAPTDLQRRIFALLGLPLGA
jgi:hypothetical protein